MKVVLVDDNPEMSQLLGAVGEIEGVETLSFTSSLDALKYLAENEADIAILDLELPVIDGLRLGKEIRKNEEIHPEKKPVHMVFYTGKDIDATIARVGDRLGVEKRYMIHKPYDLAQLVRELKRDFGQPSG
ncbi:MAG: response regulator [Acidobacteriota bacterium]